MKVTYMNSSIIMRGLIYFLLILFSISIILPFMNVIAVSLSSAVPVASGEVTIFPVGFTLKSYKTVATNDAIFQAYKNTIFVVIVGTACSLIMTMFAAFPMSKKSLPGRRYIMFFIALTLWFTGGMIPTFLVVKNVGLYNSLFALFVPTLVSAFHVVVMRNFFEGVPESLDESARIDGAGDFWILFKIYVPLSMPVIATVSLWLAVTYWNNFFNPLLYLADRSKYTLQVVLRDIVLSSSFVEYGMEARIDEDVEMVPEGIRNATILFSTIPILMVYPFLQRYFIKGVIVGAVKE